HKNKLGYTMKVTWPSDTNDESSWKQYETTGAVAAYMDDTLYMDNSKQSLQIAVDTAGEFFRINDIKINAKKSDLIVINPSVVPDDRYIKVRGDGNNLVYINPTKEEIRYLGVFFSSKPSKARWTKRLKNMIVAFLSDVSHKAMTGTLALYLINRLLVPKLMYVSQIMILSEADWIKLYKPVLKFIKRKLDLAINFSTPTLYHDNIIGVDNIWN